MWRLNKNALQPNVNRPLSDSLNISGRGRGWGGRLGPCRGGMWVHGWGPGLGTIQWVLVPWPGARTGTGTLHRDPPREQNDRQIRLKKYLPASSLEGSNYTITSLANVKWFLFHCYRYFSDGLWWDVHSVGGPLVPGSHLLFYCLQIL